MMIFWRLLLSHLLADFTLQFNFINSMKRRHVLGMVLHCATHFVVGAALTYKWLGDVWINVWGIELNGWASLLVMLVFHFIIDELRVYSLKQMGYRDGTVSFIADQILHVYVLFMISPIAIPAADFFLPEKWVGIISMFVIVTHVATVLIYFLEKDMFGKEYPSFDEKYFLIFERIVLWSFFFVSGWWWILFTAAWVAQILYIRRRRIMDLSWTNIVISVVISAIFGFWTRYIYFGALV